MNFRFCGSAHFAKGIPNAVALVLAGALAPMAHAAVEKHLDLDCYVTAIVDRDSYPDREAMWKVQRPVKTPEYRRVTITGTESTMDSVTYGLGEGKLQNWTMPIHRIHEPGKNGAKNFGIAAQTKRPDQWGYSRWFFFGSNKEGDVTNGFWTVVVYPDGSGSAAIGTCGLSAEKIVPQLKDKELRDPAESRRLSATEPDRGLWRVPFLPTRSGISMDGYLNGTVSVTWTMDTGATITNIPYDLAKQLGVKVIGERPFTLADGSVVKSQIVVIKRISLAGGAFVENVEASVSGTDTEPLLGKNFFDAFSSVEINNTEQHLTLRP